MIQDIIDEFKQTNPNFEMSLILTSYKMVGLPHVTKILNSIKQGKSNPKFKDLIAGYDMVNEEEYTKLIGEYMPQILGAQNTQGST